MGDQLSLSLRLMMMCLWTGLNILINCGQHTSNDCCFSTTRVFGDGLVLQPNPYPSVIALELTLRPSSSLKTTSSRDSQSEANQELKGYVLIII